MARLTQIAILFAGALCLLSLPAITHSAAPHFHVKGEVYCEVCRVNFINKFSEPMPGTVEGVTDDKGVYRLPVEGDHDEEECEVTLVKSSRPDCDEIPDEGWARKPSSRITLTSNSGIHDFTRNANPLGFSKKEVLPQCSELFKELNDQDF